MRHAQERYIRQCYREYTEHLRVRPCCGTANPEDASKRWRDVLVSVAAYVDTLAVPKGFPKVHLGAGGDVMAWGHTWQGGVFEGDSYDTGQPSWYWRILGTDPARWADSPANALIAWVDALEEHVGADPGANALHFTVQMEE